MHTILATTVAAATVAVAAFAAAPAFAQDANPFVGPRIEMTAGYDSTRIADQPAGTPDSVSQARIGAAIGYDIALSPKVTLGAEIGAGFTLGKGRDYRVAATDFEVDQGRDLDASLRLGYRVGDRTLIYGKAGWANSQYIARATNGTTTLRERSNEDGLRLGAGVEHMFGKSLYAKAEYRYTSYGHDVNRHQGLVGVGLRF